ncbi:hypothetical protein EXIGLDRAFT_220543 [Exidia glandulosa HHB12029]|uniref:Uncharacterized protein n=1 Tax=Exidia glandulosa HHB12029 TaxID=1314781 RepID=A0A165MPQ2_EXIGL|nr:hypothetical protein EXIGLDRAFT_220543 [Exidia glandulosa HHB12029]
MDVLQSSSEQTPLLLIRGLSLALGCSGALRAPQSNLWFYRSPKVSTGQVFLFLERWFHGSTSLPSTIVLRGVDLARDEIQEDLFNIVRVVEEDAVADNPGGTTPYDAISNFPLWDEESMRSW